MFLDANILLDIYDASRSTHTFSMQALSFLAQDKDIELFSSCDIVTTIYYIAAKKNKAFALDAIMAMNDLCEIVTFSNNEVKESGLLMKNNPDYTDLEDTIQYVMAKKMQCDLILSNDKGFVSTDIKLMSTKMFCEVIGV